MIIPREQSAVVQVSMQLLVQLAQNRVIQTRKIRLHVCKEILLKPIHLKTNKDKNRKEATPRGTNSFPRPSDLSGVDFSDEAVDFESEETVLDPRSASGLLRHSGDQLAYGVLSSVSGIQCMRSAYSIAFS